MADEESLKESWGAHPSAELSFLDEDESKIRLRVREPHGKASIFLTDDDLEWLIERLLLIRERRSTNRASRCG